MKKIRTTLILLFIINILTAQNPLVKNWDFRYGGTNGDVLFSTYPTTDGGYILGGGSLSGIGGDKSQASWGITDYWIVKIDSLGNKQWDKRFGGTNDDQLYSLQQTSDRGYILGGWSNSGISGDKTQACWGSYDYWIVKIDSMGTKQWDKRFGGSGNDQLYSLHQTSDGGYILGGWSESGISGDKTQPSQGGYDFWIVKTDSSGVMQWDKRLGGAADESLYSLQQTTDGGYIVGGSSFSYVSGDKTEPSWGFNDFWIVKIDSIGTKQWDKRYGGTARDGLVSLQQTSDRGYILGGYAESGTGGDITQPSFGLYDYWIVKTDSNGFKLWDNRFGGSDNEELYNIVKTNDNGYLISGDSYSNISGNKSENNLGIEQTWIIKTDSLGNTQWDKTIFTTGHDEAGYAFPTTSGCYTIANYTNSGIGGDKTQPSQGAYDYWIVNFCDTTSTTGINNNTNFDSQILVYPNPFSNRINITVKRNEYAEINLYDVTSRKIFNQSFINSTSINTEHLAKGLYLYEVWSKNGSCKKGKVVKD